MNLEAYLSRYPTHPTGCGFQDLTGATFGRLTVVAFSGTHSRVTRWLCRCDCGGWREASASHIKRGLVSSCGCVRREAASRITHGLSNSREWRAWCAMRRRCSIGTEHNFHRYGGRGISVCDRWRESFENFYADMGSIPGRGYSLERKDNEGNYEPGNCKWATPKEQSRNRRSTRLLTAMGKTACLQEWADSTGIKLSTIHRRLRLGWSAEDAVGQPVAIGYAQKLAYGRFRDNAVAEAD